MTVPIESAPRNHVLVVDDELSVRELLADALDAYGYTIRTAASAAEGYRIVEEGDTHLVLSDIDMPGESGLDLLRRIKAHDADIDVIMVTGVVDVDTAIGAIREGAADYVAKPFNIEEVRIVVERTVRNRLLVLENRAYQLHLEEMVRQRTRELEESYEATLQALDPDEWVEMRRHPEMGYRMLRHIGYFTPALDIVLSHQERWDGSGYPRGLKGEEIPLGARIFAVVDTFDAMTSDRPYRRALSVDAAREEVGRFAGIQFDPRVAAAFLSIGDEIWAEIRARVRRDLDATVSRLRDEGA
jgi:response regulator RpfG family c-di-GMP phosphodiesterase